MDSHSFPSVQMKDFPGIPIPGQSSEQYSLEYIKTHGCIVLDCPADGNNSMCPVTVGLTLVSSSLISDLRDFHNGTVRFVELDHAEFSAFLSRIASRGESPDLPGSGKAARHAIDRLANDAPNINLVNSIIIEAIRRKASDIHLECFESSGIIRYRIDGVLHMAGEIEFSRFPGVSSRLKIMAGLNIMEKRLPQDGRMSVDLGSETVDMRISTVPASRGESIVMRIFNKQKEAFDLESLGFPTHGIDVINTISRQSNGLFLVTGPTGSGKSTTLYAILRRLNRPESKLVTIEDPIEQEIPGVNQIQVNEAIDLSFGSLLRRILRQDPDIIMVGEIRDAETAELAIRAAMTGHLVLSTLHTNDAVSSIHRLCNMGIPAYLLGAVLKGVLAQRLVRRLCPHCARKTALKGSEKEFARRNKWAIKTAAFPVGCEKCADTGYSGRTAIMETISYSPDLEDMIARGDSTPALRRYLNENGMKCLIHDGYDKVIAGETSISEIERTAGF